MRFSSFVSLCVLGAVALLATPQSSFADDQAKPFQIHVVDEDTGRGVPLVELKTVHDLTFISDSSGRVAVREPELWGTDVFFHVRSHGYEHSKDGFGSRGRTVHVEPGGKVEFRIKRINLAERLYRITGHGIYADSVLLGEQTPIDKPLSNGLVAGSDSVVTAVYHNKLYWFWGDTNRLRYPLGNFQVSGATSQLPNHGGMDPAKGINLNYFSETASNPTVNAPNVGFVKPMARMPGEGPTWIFGIAVLRDDDGRERMLTGYEKIKPPLTVYERGIAEFDDDRTEFVMRRRFEAGVPLFPYGHPFKHTDQGTDYFVWGDTFPVVRVRATVSAFLDLSQYEGYTCFQEGVQSVDGSIERDSKGKLILGWKRNTLPLTIDHQNQLLKQGKIRDDEAPWRIVDVETGRSVIPHRGSVGWNEHRKRWTMIFTQINGTSVLGEVWYMEAEKPEGPWQKARKIVSHDKYSFYNPRQHSYFDGDSGRYVFFEGTYTQMFSGNPSPTPRYEYNQIMYRLDVDAPELMKLRSIN